MSRPSPRNRRWLAAYLLVAVVQVGAEAVRAELVSGVGLVLAMPVLAGLVLSAGLQRRHTGRLLLVGLGFSWLGDTLDWLILVKISFFLIAQICYVAAFWPYRRQVARHPAVRPAYVITVVLLVVLVGREAGSLVAPVVLYGSALALMAVLATGVNRLTGLGGMVFVVSDALLGIDTFVGSVTVPAS